MQGKARKAEFTRIKKSAPKGGFSIYNSYRLWYKVDSVGLSMLTTLVAKFYRYKLIPN